MGHSKNRIYARRRYVFYSRVRNVTERIDRCVSWLAIRCFVTRCRASAVSKDEFVPPVEVLSLHAIRGAQATRHHSAFAGPSCVLRRHDGTDTGAGTRAAQHPRSRAQQDTRPTQADQPILPRRVPKLSLLHSKSDDCDPNHSGLISGLISDLNFDPNTL